MSAKEGESAKTAGKSLALGALKLGGTKSSGGGLGSKGTGGGLGSKGKAGSIEPYIPGKTKYEAFFKDLADINKCPDEEDIEENYARRNPPVTKKTGASYIKDVEFDGVYFDQLLVFKESQ